MSELTGLLRPTRACKFSAYRRISRAVSQHYEAAFRGSELHAAQFTILSTLAQTGAMPLVKLAAFLGMERTTLTRNLEPLVKRNLVVSETNEDGRIRQVALTSSGESAVRNTFPRWEAAQATVEEVLKQHRV